MLPPDDNYETTLMNALQIDLRNLCSTIHSSIKRPPRTEFDKVVRLGYEHISLQLQTYRRSVPMSTMLMNHLFGKNYQNITQNESI